MANLSLIDWKLSLYIKVNVNDRQNILARILNGHNSVIFHPI